MTERKASMGDKVYRGDVVKFIRNNISLGTFMKRTVKAADEACWDLCDKLNYVPAIEEKPEPHWIPVEQDLPKIGEYVLCETTARYFGKYHVCKFVDKDEWVDRPHFDWDRNGFPHVIAWTRFEPYKGMTIPPECEGDCGWCKPSVIEKCKGVKE